MNFMELSGKRTSEKYQLTASKIREELLQFIF